MTTLFDKRFRGFRVINLAGWGLLATLILGVYLAKTFAWRERNEIAAVETQIRQERLRIRLLQAEVAYLEQPRRLESLSTVALGMAAITPKQEISAGDLQRFARPRPKAETVAAIPPQTQTLAQAVTAQTPPVTQQ